MKSTHRYSFIDAKISNFIHRKTATLGQRRRPVATNKPDFGLNYEMTDSAERSA